MKTTRPLLLLSAFILLIAWLAWPDQSQPDSPIVGESGISLPQDIAPATLEEARVASPEREVQVVAPPQIMPPDSSEAATPTDPEEETGKVSVRIVDSFGNHVRQGEVLVLQHHTVVQTLVLNQDDALFHCELPASEAYEFMVKPDSLEGGLIPQLRRSRGTQNARFPKDPNDLEHFARAYVRLKANDVLSLDLKVSAPVRAYGRVVGPGGGPLEGIMVRLSGLDQEASGLAEISMTNGLGEFQFAEVFPGNHRLLLFVAPESTAENENWNPSAPRDVEILPGQDMDFGVIPIGGGQASVSGWIVNQDGIPFSDLPILCFSNQEVKEGLAPHNFGSQLGKTTTNEDGYFSLNGLEAGPIKISLTPDFEPRSVLGAGHPAMWEPNIEVDLASAGSHVDLGELVVEESRPFLIIGSLTFDDAWLASTGHSKKDLRIYVSQVKGEALPEGVRRNPVRKQRISIDWSAFSYRGAVETPMTPLTLTFKLKGYDDLEFPVRPEALHTLVQDIQVPSDFE